MQKKFSRLVTTAVVAGGLVAAGGSAAYAADNAADEPDSTTTGETGAQNDTDEKVLKGLGDEKESAGPVSSLLKETGDLLGIASEGEDTGANDVVPSPGPTVPGGDGEEPDPTEPDPEPTEPDPEPTDPGGGGETPDPEPTDPGGGGETPDPNPTEPGDDSGGGGSTTPSPNPPGGGAEETGNNISTPPTVDVDTDGEGGVTVQVGDAVPVADGATDTVAGDGELAETGFSTGTAAGVAGGMVLTGAALIALRRKYGMDGA